MCVFSVFVFCFVLFVFLFVSLFVFSFSFFLGRDRGQYSHSFINLWNLGGGDITEPIFRPM